MEDIRDIYGWMDFIYECKKCGQRFPIYWVSDSDWRKSGYGTKTICKTCLEKRVPEPRYCTLDEYIEKRINTRGTEGYVVENTRRVLNHIWNLPAEKEFE
jgi:hypothetical protein